MVGPSQAMSTIRETRFKQILNFGLLILSEMIATIFKSTFCENSKVAMDLKSFGAIFCLQYD